MTDRSLVEQHYIDLSALPSSLPAYRRIVELVRQGCADTTKWAGCTDSRDRVEYATALQLGLVKAAMRQLGRLSCGVLVEVSSVQDKGLLMPRLPPRSGFGMYGEMPELNSASGLLQSERRGTHLPGEDVEAAALLLQAAAYLERALSCPPGFVQTEAQ